MPSMTALPAMSGRPPLPQKPQPHERDGRQPQPGDGHPHPHTARHDDADRETFSALYTAYRPLVLRTAARALRPDAQDVWLDTWLHLLRGGGELHDPADFLTTRTRRLAREQAADYGDDLALHHLTQTIGDVA
ncbi:hypothetical protein KVH31_36305 [Streptomyces olivaceus]|uniref:RNA polymerase sigma factor n=1 Tax=Streptomyces olivaceus TaxID=47716 RepID=UPI001CCADA54|nr:hypothetical protein [Streptomyces olivaceus]MBZ6211962.1 hypothetical protein [Streptomyces olivaceus]